MALGSKQRARLARGAPQRGPTSAAKSAQPSPPVATASVQAATGISATELQRQLHELDDCQMGKVLDFLASDLKTKDGEEEHYELDVHNMPPSKLTALYRIVAAARAPPASSVAKALAPPVSSASSAAKSAPAYTPTAGAVSSTAVPKVGPLPPQLQLPPQGPPPQVQTAVRAVSNGSGRALAAKTPGATAAPLRRPPEGAIATAQQQRELALRRRVQAPQESTSFGAPAFGNGVVQRSIAEPMHPSSGVGQPWQAGGNGLGHGQLSNAARYAPRSQDWRWHDHAGLPQGHLGGFTADPLAGTPLEADNWLGEEGCWAADARPPEVSVRELVVPKICSGDTEPPGPCDAKCHCFQNVVSSKTAAEQPWRTADRLARAQAALQAFVSHGGVFRRGRVSGQSRFEPAPPGWHERALQASAARQAPQQPQPGLHPSSSGGVIVLAADATPPRSI